MCHFMGALVRIITLPHSVDASLHTIARPAYGGKHCANLQQHDCPLHHRPTVSMGLAHGLQIPTG